MFPLVGLLRSVAGRVGRWLPSRASRAAVELAEMRARIRQLEQRNVSDQRKAKMYAWAYRRVMAAAQGLRPQEVSWPDNAGPPLADLSVVRMLYAQAQFAEQLQTGKPLADAVAEFVRARLRIGDHVVARSLSYALQRHAATGFAGHLGLALTHCVMGRPDLAWVSFREVPKEIWRRLAASQYVVVAFRTDRDAAIAAVGDLIADPPADVPPNGWLDIIEATAAAREVALADAVLTVVDRLAGEAPAVWAESAGEREWLRRWLDKEVPAPTESGVPAGHVSLAVLGYQHPRLASATTNLGHYLHTLAALANVARHQRLRFHGPAELVELAADLQRRVQPARRLATASRDVTMLAVNRDASSRDPIPERTWLIAAGWFMDDDILGSYDFPLHPQLRPIFVSFHCSRLEMLSPAALDYLRRYAPVGCRDWTTVDLLLAAGVPAFFSGCVTTTLDTVLPPRGDPPAAEAPVGYVEVPTSDGGVSLCQDSQLVRGRGLAANLRHALEFLKDCQRCSAVVTSRHSCYVSARSVGARVELRPDNAADVRFNWLSGLSDTEYDAIRWGMLNRLQRTLDAILAGDSEHDVYARWQDLCAADVATAQARRDAVLPVPATTFDVGAACARVRAGQVVKPRTVRDPADLEEVHVALALDGNLTQQLKVVVEALTRTCSRPLHLWILCRGLRQADYDHLAALFPSVTVTWLPCDHVDYAPDPLALDHITVSGIDRLLLPDLLPELERIVYHDIDALPLADICELYDWNLQGQPLAARTEIGVAYASGFNCVGRRAMALQDDPAAAHDLIRRISARHDYGFAAFNSGVLVLDLTRMRSDGFGQEFLPFLGRYRMNDEEVLNCYAGPNHAVLLPQWNAFATRQLVVDPKLIHWSGASKPWQPYYVPFQERWEEFAWRLSSREAKLVDTAGAARIGDHAGDQPRMARVRPDAG